MGALECREVGKKYGDFTLGPISCVIEEGFLTGLIGVNGAGKSTLLNIMAGIDSRFEGDVILDGVSMRENPALMKQKIALVSERISFFMDKTPLENAQLLGIYFDSWSTEDFYLWLDRLELPKGKFLYQFSKGMKMKFQLAFAMAHRSQFLLLDEPTAGLDPVFRRDFLKIVQQIRAEGTGILMSTHITGDLDHIADYIMLLDNGKEILFETREALEDEGKKDVIDGYIETDFHIAELLRRNGGRKDEIL